MNYEINLPKLRNAIELVFITQISELSEYRYLMRCNQLMVGSHLSKTKRQFYQFIHINHTVGYTYHII